MGGDFLGYWLSPLGWAIGRKTVGGFAEQMSQFDEHSADAVGTAGPIWGRLGDTMLPSASHMSSMSHMDKRAALLRIVNIVEHPIIQGPASRRTCSAGRGRGVGARGSGVGMRIDRRNVSLQDLPPHQDFPGRLGDKVILGMVWLPRRGKYR